MRIGDWISAVCSPDLTVRCEPNHRAGPVTLEEIQAEVVRATDEGERLRVIGSGASFSPLCACDDNHLSLRRFSGIDSVDVQRSRVLVRGGTTLRELGSELANLALALESAPSWNQVTIAGALATGSHGRCLSYGHPARTATVPRLGLAAGLGPNCKR